MKFVVIMRILVAAMLDGITGLSEEEWTVGVSQKGSLS